MTELSPAAQAIEDAYFNADGFGYRNGLAAALRAAVKQTRKRKVMKTFGMTMVKGPVYCLESDLLSIAAELEAPCLLTRALAGDKDAARQFLFEAGFTDEHGQLTGPYKSEQAND
jgi:hypothetical protein